MCGGHGEVSTKDKKQVALSNSTGKNVHLSSRPVLSRSPILPIEQVKSVKYLGVILDSHLSWNDHVGQANNLSRLNCHMQALPSTGLVINKTPYELE